MNYLRSVFAKASAHHTDSSSRQGHRRPNQHNYNTTHHQASPRHRISETWLATRMIRCMTQRRHSPQTSSTMNLWSNNSSPLYQKRRNRRGRNPSHHHQACLQHSRTTILLKSRKMRPQTEKLKPWMTGPMHQQAPNQAASNTHRAWNIGWHQRRSQVRHRCHNHQAALNSC